MLHHPKNIMVKRNGLKKFGSQSYMHAVDQYFASKFYEEFVAHASLHLEEHNLLICRPTLALCRCYTFEIDSDIKF